MNTVNMDIEDPFGPLTGNTMAQSSASTSYTIMSPRAFSSSPLVPNLLSQKGSPATATDNSASAVPSLSASRTRQSSTTAITNTPAMNSVTSPSTMVRAVSPPTPAPSPQPDLGIHVHAGGSGNGDTANALSNRHAASSHATPAHPGSVLMAHSGSAAMGEPGTPISPGTEDAQGLAWGDPNVHIHSSHFQDDQGQSAHIDPEVQEALFAEQFIHSIVSYFPRLTGPERRTLFTSLLPYMSGEDLLHLSHLISPYLRRDFLAELPAEIALKILGFIDDPKDLMRASRVSRTWRSLVADEQNWKLMLEKYHGGGWSEARPALAPTSAALAPPFVANGRAATSSSGAAGTSHSAARQGRPSSSTSANEAVATASGSVTHIPSERLAVIAQASRSRIQEYRPSSHAGQNSFHGLSVEDALLSSSTSSSSKSEKTSATMAESGSSDASLAQTSDAEDENVNRFLQENQTPLAERVRRGKGRNKGKGKGRASDNGEDGPSFFAKDLSATGYSGEGGMPGPSTSGTVGLLSTTGTSALGSTSGPAQRSLHGLGVLPPRRGSALTAYHTLPSAAAVLASQQGQAAIPRYVPGANQSESLLPYLAAPQLRMPFPPPAPQYLHHHLGQLSLGSNAAPTLPMLSIPSASLSEAFSSSSNASTTAASSAVSPSATFAPAYTSPAQFATPSIASGLNPPLSPNAPSIVTSDQLSPIHARRTCYILPDQQPHSAPQPSKVRIAKSQNPFGTAQTNLSYTTQYSQNKQYPPTTSASASKPFSYKTQFKKAYLTESNWLKGPGRVLSRQTCTDDGVVTSLGFDNEWIIVGMATNQIHVFDAKTGAYVQQLVGHTLGVWCLVLVSKGGQRVDKDGKRVKTGQSSRENRTPSVFGKAETMSWESESDGESLSSQEEVDGNASPTMARSSSTGFLRADGMERTRSASARPADRERFFSEASDSPSASPNLEPNDGSPRTRPEHGSRRLSSGTPSSETPKHRRSSKRPSSFCGVPSSGPSSSAQDGASSSSARFASNPSGFPFGGDGANISPQQAAACGTAQGWGQAGAVAVSGGCDRDVRVWDVATG